MNWYEWVELAHMWKGLATNVTHLYLKTSKTWFRRSKWSIFIMTRHIYNMTKYVVFSTNGSFPTNLKMVKYNGRFSPKESKWKTGCWNVLENYKIICNSAHVLSSLQKFHLCCQQNNDPVYSASLTCIFIGATFFLVILFYLALFYLNSM